MRKIGPRGPIGPIFLALVFSCGALEFTERESAHLRQALRALNATEADLGFQKDVDEPRSALRWIRDALHQPLSLNRAGQAIWDAANSSDPDAVWRVAVEFLEADVPHAEPPAEPSAHDWDGCPPELKSALAAFLLEASHAALLVESASGSLTREEMELLAVVSLGGTLRVEDDPDARAALEAAGIAPVRIETFIEDSRALDARPAAERFLDTAEKFQVGALLEAGRIFSRAAAALAAAARGVTDWPAQTRAMETPLGPIYILGPDELHFSHAALLVIAPAGSQRYSGDAAAANGLIGHRLSGVIDLDGDDLYASSNLLGAAAALFGVSVVIDCSGDDTWRPNFVGPAAGFWGAGWLEDRAGNDLYESRTLGQGAALAGLGVLLDKDGHDSYGIGSSGQGFAGWRGFGILLDHKGNDRYFAGGLEADHERNPDRFISLAQGFAIGMRPFAGGGIGALIDLEGNDRYLADVYGQGVSYYYSAGFLIDGSGHDRYDVHHYGQGCGIHLSHGLLVDRDGDDRYVGGTLVQGAAHDFAVGGLLDRAGNDTYLASQHAQGHGMNNALGWLVDITGDDVYDARDPLVSQGVGNTGGFRESGSIGLLLDLGGQDRYSVDGADGRCVLRPLYGVVFDAESEDAP